MASQVSHARRVLRVLNSFEQAREERLSYTGRASDLGDSSHQNVGDLTGVSPILEQAAVGEYSAAAERRLGEGRSFSEGISARKHSTSTQIRPTVIGQSCSSLPANAQGSEPFRLEASAKANVLCASARGSRHRP